MDFINSHVLSFITFAPLLTAILTVIVPSVSLARQVSMAGSVVTFLGTCHIWYWFKGDTHGLQFVEQYWWIKEFGIKYFMGVDGLNLLLVVLTGFLTPLILVSVWHIDDAQQKSFLYTRIEETPVIKNPNQEHGFPFQLSKLKLAHREYDQEHVPLGVPVQKMTRLQSKNQSCLIQTTLTTPNMKR